MKILICILATLSMVACASQKRVPTFKEAVAENENLESGVYNKSNGENVSVEVKSMRAAIEEAEKAKYEAQREANYLKLKNQEQEYENLLLRARGNYKAEREVREIESFDRQNNPVIRQRMENREPAQIQEPQGRVNHRVSPYNVSPRPAPTLAQEPAPNILDPRKARAPVAQEAPAAPAIEAPAAPQTAPIASGEPVAESVTQIDDVSPVADTAKAAVPAVAASEVASALPKPLINQ